MAVPNTCITPLGNTTHMISPKRWVEFASTARGTTFFAIHIDGI